MMTPTDPGKRIADPSETISPAPASDLDPQLTPEEEADLVAQINGSYYLQPNPASADAMVKSVARAIAPIILREFDGETLERADRWDDIISERDRKTINTIATAAIFSITQQYGDQCRAEADAAGFRRGVGAAAPVMQSLRRAVELYTCHPCALCGGDCSSANPPVLSCPTQGALEAFRKHDQLLALLETQEKG